MTNYKKADIILPFILTLSIVAVVLVPLYSSPAIKDVLCGDTSIAQQVAKISYIEWNEDVINCNNATGACSRMTNGTTISKSARTFPGQFLSAQIGVLVSLIFMLMFEGVNKGVAYFFRLLGFFLSGIFITVALAIFLGNVTGTHSPTFIDSCKSNPSVQELCKSCF